MDTIGILNFVICSAGAMACLYTLIIDNIDTRRWAQLSGLCLMGLAFVTWLVFGMAYHSRLVPENLIGRGLCLLATLSFISIMRDCNYNHTNRDGSGNDQ